MSHNCTRLWKRHFAGKKHGALGTAPGREVTFTGYEGQTSPVCSNLPFHTQFLLTAGGRGPFI